jgi:hypothetical protein
MPNDSVIRTAPDRAQDHPALDRGPRQFARSRAERDLESVRAKVSNDQEKDAAHRAKSVLAVPVKPAAGLAPGMRFALNFASSDRRDATRLGSDSNTGTNSEGTR